MFKVLESGMIKIRGIDYNISNLKIRVYTHAASTIASDLNRLWENDWDIDSIILSGGGSVELSKYLTPHIEGNVISIGKNSDARFKNVQGYCKFGRYKWGYPKFLSDNQEEKQNKIIVDDDPGNKNTNLAKNDLKNIEKTSKKISWLKRQS